MWQQAAPENGPRIMQVYRATVSINLEKGAYVRHAPFSQTTLADRLN
jgi:hypothetical protein